MRARAQEVLLDPLCTTEVSLLERPDQIFRVSEGIVVNSSGSPYPELDEPHHRGMSTWCKAELWEFTRETLGIILDVHPVHVNGESWDIARRPLQLGTSDAFIIGHIPFNAITAIDSSPSEDGHGPRIYCRFKYGGTPYCRRSAWHIIRGDKTQYKYLKPSERIEYFPVHIRREL